MIFYRKAPQDFGILADTAKDEERSEHCVVLVLVTNMIAKFVFLFEAQIHVETEKLVIMSAPEYTM